MVDVLAWTLPFRFYQEIIESAIKTTVRLKYKPVFVLKCQYLSSWFLFFSESLKSIKEYPCLYSVFTYILIRDNYHALLTPRLNSSNRYFSAGVMSSSLNLLIELRSKGIRLLQLQPRDCGTTFRSIFILKSLYSLLNSVLKLYCFVVNLVAFNCAIEIKLPWVAPFLMRWWCLYWVEESNYIFSLRYCSQILWHLFMLVCIYV